MGAAVALLLAHIKMTLNSNGSFQYVARCTVCGMSACGEPTRCGDAEFKYEFSIVFSLLRWRTEWHWFWFAFFLAPSRSFFFHRCFYYSVPSHTRSSVVFCFFFRFQLHVQWIGFECFGLEMAINFKIRKLAELLSNWSLIVWRTADVLCIMDMHLFCHTRQSEIACGNAISAFVCLFVFLRVGKRGRVVIRVIVLVALRR